MRGHRKYDEGKSIVKLREKKRLERMRVSVYYIFGRMLSQTIFLLSRSSSGQALGAPRS